MYMYTKYISGTVVIISTTADGNRQPVGMQWELMLDGPLRATNIMYIPPTCTCTEKTLHLRTIKRNTTKHRRYVAVFAHLEAGFLTAHKRGLGCPSLHPLYPGPLRVADRGNLVVEPSRLLLDVSENL